MNINFKIPSIRIKNTENKHRCFNKNLNFKGKTNDDAIEILGTQTKAKVYTDNIDYKTYQQIKNICSHPVFKDMPIRIMPDVHIGSNTVVGFSSPVSDIGIIPGIVGSDIGCGMLCVQFDTQGQDIDFEKLDNIINTYISNKRTKKPKISKKISDSLKRDIEDVYKDSKFENPDFQKSMLGTLGGGNHFIEIDKDKSGKYYLIIQYMMVLPCFENFVNHNIVASCNYSNQMVLQFLAFHNQHLLYLL